VAMWLEIEGLRRRVAIVQAGFRVRIEYGRP
jgi:hypothetical protein